MFADKTLTPREAVRLCALGTIAEGPLRYSDLASSVRHFITRLTGPSLDLLGSSIELLRYEGLVESLEGEGMEDDALLTISAAGRDAFHDLMTAPLRSASDLSKLITALKFRFLHLLPADDQAEQVDLLIDTSETGLARLVDLRRAMADQAGHMVAWLDEEIGRAESRLAWLESLRDSVATGP
jgi:DNA-binding PadR family transcriptional regulator